MHAQLLAGLMLATLVPLAAAQSTWYVDANGTPPGSGTPADPYTSIQFALDQPTTVTGDTVLVLPGTYVENLRLAGNVIVRSSAGPDVTALRAASPGTLVRVTAVDGFIPQATLEGFTVDGSADPSGTGIQVQNTSFASLRLERCVVRGFTSGRAVFVHQDSYLDAFRSTIALNAVGAELFEGIHGWGNLALTGCILRDNGVAVTPASVLPVGFQSAHSCLPLDLAAQFPFTNTGERPRFWNVAAGDLHLAPGSPCMDAAGSAFPPDPDGSPADMGALGYDPGHAFGPESYCTAKPASAGCLAHLSANGTASASGASPFTIDAHDVLNNKLTVAFYGFGPLDQPFQGGTLCVQAPLRRLPAQLSGGNPGGADCSGSLSIDFGAWVSGGNDLQLVPGALVHLQVWYRDPSDPAGFGGALSDALAFGVAP